MAKLQLKEQQRRSDLRKKQMEESDPQIVAAEYKEYGEMEAKL